MRLDGSSDDRYVAIGSARQGRHRAKPFEESLCLPERMPDMECNMPNSRASVTPDEVSLALFRLSSLAEQRYQTTSMSYERFPDGYNRWQVDKRLP